MYYSSNYMYQHSYCSMYDPNIKIHNYSYKMYVYSNIDYVNTQKFVCITSYKYKYSGMNMNVLI